MEVKVYSGGTNVARQGTAKMSSTRTSLNPLFLSHVASNAIDGLTSNIRKYARSNDEDRKQGVVQLRWHLSTLQTH